jgi:hypothetical protein
MCALATLCAGAPALAQDLEPRAYSASPVGTNFVAVGFGRSTGAIVFDPSVPFTDVEAHVSGATLGLGRTFDLWGRQALVTALVPYSWGDIEGSLGEQRGRITRSGLADVRLRLSVNLLNGAALSRGEFAGRPRRTIVGASLSVVAPTGQYDPAKLINLGTNRWAFKPEVGVSHPVGRWDLDGYAGVWLYTANNDFFPGGLRRTQAPLFAGQGHVNYTFRPRLWAAFDATWYSGGAVRVGGGPPTSRLNNVRAGATVSIPLRAGQSLKLAYSDGVATRTGSQFRAFAVAYQVT